MRLLVSLARRADVVYTTGMLGRSSLGSLLGRTPFVTKLTADPAYERARRWGLAAGSLEEFQRHAALSTLPLRVHARPRRAARRARRHAVGLPAGAGDRLGRPGGAGDAAAEPGPAAAGARRRATSSGSASASTGRRSCSRGGSRPRSRSTSGIEAARRAGVALAIAGDGPDRAALERLGYGRFLGPLPRREVLELFRAGDASLLSSAWENFPHTVVEALAVGTPVIATRTGGVGEVLRDGENGLVVEPGDVDALARRRSSASSPTRSSLRACGQRRRRRSPTTRPTACTGGSSGSWSAPAG